MEICFTVAENYIERQSVRALAALATPGWTKAVIGTAAAMVIETARPMCAKQLIVEVTLLPGPSCQHSRQSMQTCLPCIHTGSAAGSQSSAEADTTAAWHYKQYSHQGCNSQ